MIKTDAQAIVADLTSIMLKRHFDAMKDLLEVALESTDARVMKSACRAQSFIELQSIINQEYTDLYDNE